MYSWIPKNPQEHKAAAAARAMGLTQDIAGWQEFKKAAPFTAGALMTPEGERRLGTLVQKPGENAGTESGWARLDSVQDVYEAETGIRRR